MPPTKRRRRKRSRSRSSSRTRRRSASNSSRIIKLPTDYKDRELKDPTNDTGIYSFNGYWEVDSSTMNRLSRLWFIYTQYKDIADDLQAVLSQPVFRPFKTFVTNYAKATSDSQREMQLIKFANAISTDPYWPEIDDWIASHLHEETERLSLMTDTAQDMTRVADLALLLEDYYAGDIENNGYIDKSARKTSIYKDIQRLAEALV